MKKVAILAGNYNQYMQFLSDKEDKHNYIFCNDFKDIAGREFSKQIIIGTFHERKDASKIIQEVMARIR